MTHNERVPSDASLVQGRDRAYIRDELFVSDAAIKTHTQRIHAKMGIHTKQELISLVQQAARGARRNRSSQ